MWKINRSEEDAKRVKEVMKDMQKEMDKLRSMSGPKMGSWSVHSESDPRWNKSGRTGGPDEMGKWIEKCKNKYGDPPDDTTMGFLRD